MHASVLLPRVLVLAARAAVAGSHANGFVVLAGDAIVTGNECDVSVLAGLAITAGQLVVLVSVLAGLAVGAARLGGGQLVGACHAVDAVRGRVLGDACAAVLARATRDA